MSEAQRWKVKNTLPNSDGGTPFIRPEVVLAADFDRVTADRDALQRDLEQQKRYVEINANSAHGKHKESMQYRAERDALQQRLTAADERADVLEGLLREVVVLDPRGEFLGWQLDGKIEAALKPLNGDCHHGYASILECPECGAPYQ